jgi:hypothetical protein
MEPYMYSLVQRCKNISSQLFSIPSGRCLCFSDLLATSKIVEVIKPDSSREIIHQQWFSLALTDAALFHCILCGSALFSDQYVGRADSPERFKHMNEAVRLLNKKLQVSGDTLADSTLVAVAHLADFEVRLTSLQFCL